jgi:hypothetical protein
MRTWQLVGIRVYMLTLGRWAPMAGLLRKLLVLLLVRGRGGAGYHASAGFFIPKELDE